MPEPMRISLPDDVSQRHARARFIIIAAMSAIFAAYLAAITLLKPPFIIFAGSAAVLALALMFALTRNPLEILTLRMQKKLAARDLVFGGSGVTIINIDGGSRHFDGPRTDVFLVSEHMGGSYYLQIADNAGNATYYLGMDFSFIEPLGDALRRIGALDANAGKKQK